MVQFHRLFTGVGARLQSLPLSAVVLPSVGWGLGIGSQRRASSGCGPVSDSSPPPSSYNLERRGAHVSLRRARPRRRPNAQCPMDFIAINPRIGTDSTSLRVLYCTLHSALCTLPVVLRTITHPSPTPVCRRQ